MKIMYSLMNSINMLIIICIVATTITGGFVLAQESSSTIDTFPFLPENILATGYSGLQLTTQVEKSNMYDQCEWQYGDNVQLPVFRFNILCQNRSASNENLGSFVTTCVNNSHHLITSLVVQSPIVSLKVVQMLCRESGGEFEIISSINLNVTNCSSSLPLVVDAISSTYNSAGTFLCTNNENLYYTNGTQATVPQTTCLATAKWSGEENVECFKGCNITYPLVVVSNSIFYNSSGTFSCANNGILFYSNGTQLTSTQTTCLVTAEWSGQNGLGCGKAPDVVINGELTVIEGEDVTLTCDYVDVFPFGNQSAFYFRELTMVLDQGQSFTLPSVKRSDNNKPVSCQALTPFTQIHPETGRSDARFIKVLYAPYQDNPTTCTWLADLSQICKISFYANTNVTFGQITKDGALVNGILSPVTRDDDDLVSFQFGLLEVTFSDAGSYQVHLTSIVPPHNYVVYFDIDVASNPADGFLIGLICAAVYGVVVSAIVIGQYCKSSKDVKLKDQRVYYEATTSKANNPIPDGTYLTIDDVKSSSAENNKPTEYLTPNEINSEAVQPLPADGYENIIVSENEDVDSKRKSSTKTSYENFAGSESKSSKNTKNPSSSNPIDEYEILNPQIAHK